MNNKLKPTEQIERIKWYEKLNRVYVASNINNKFE